MNPTPEENKELLEEESTIFTASPVREREKSVKSSQKRFIGILSAVLALVIAGGAMVSVHFLLPAPLEETSSVTENPTVTGLTNSQVEFVEFYKGEEKAVFLATEKEDSSSSESATVVWSVEGMSEGLVEPIMISSHMDTLLRMRELRSVAVDADMDYGFSNPIYRVHVTCKNEADSCGYIIGKEVSDGSGNYARREGEEHVFVVSSEDIAILKKPLEELSISTVIPAQKSTSETADYFSEGVLARFDEITVKQKGKAKIVIKPNPNEVTASVIASVLTEPANRYADDEITDALFKIASEGLFAEYAYKYDPTEKDLKEFGLTDPQFSYTLCYKDVRIAFKAAPRDLGYYAVISEANPNIIFKVKEESLPFVLYEKEQFASSQAFLERLSDLKKITFKANGKETVIDIRYFEEEEDGEDFQIKLNGRTIDAENFIAYYDYLLGMELNEVSFERASGEEGFSIVTEYADGSGGHKLVLLKSSSRRYFVESDSVPLGFVASAYVDKLIDYLDMVSKNEEIPKAF